MERPRFFIASDHADLDDDGLDPAQAPSEPAFVLDAFMHVTAGSAAHAATEVITGLDALGGLGLWPLDARDERLSSLRAHLTHAEVATPQRRRIESARGGLWLFALELIEQLPDAPGANDPIYLYGTLWPADDPTALGQRGQLTSTRGDVLRGLVEGVPWAFLYPPDAHDRTPRAFHLLLPADRVDALAAGRGMVLAYPATDPGLLLDHAGNDLQVLQLFHDLLAALYKDGDRVSPRSAQDNAPPLPVPDRRSFLADLEGHGWKVDKRAGIAEKQADDGGFFKNLFGNKTTVKLPAQATIEDYAQRARGELARLAGWPTQASSALFARTGPWSGVVTSPLSRIPTPPAPPRTPMATSPRPEPTPGPKRPERGEWMRDFVQQHAAHKPQLTPLRQARPVASTPARTSRPDWMKDFD